MKCQICGSELIKVECIGPGIADFAILQNDESMTESNSEAIKEVMKSTGGILHSENENAKYCNKCRQVQVIYSID